MTAYVILFATSVACGAVLWRCRARYRTPGGAAAQFRTHPASRALVCVLCVELAAAGLMARGAYADAYQVAWSTDSDGTQWCFVVSPDNEFDATLYALGLGMYPLSQDQRAYLSSAQYGGMFYTISQRWAPIQHYLSEYEGSSLYTQFLAFVMDTPLMQVTYNIMGMDAYTNVWTATISDAEKEQAKQDFNDVVNGNVGGGGGGSGGDNGLVGPTNSLPSSFSLVGFGKYYNKGLMEQVQNSTMSLTGDALAQFETLKSKYTYAYALVTCNTRNARSVECTPRVVYSNTPLILNVTTSNPIDYGQNNGQNARCDTFVVDLNYQSRGKMLFYTGSTVTWSYTSTPLTNFNISNQGSEYVPNYSSLYNFVGAGYLIFGTSVVTPPENNWPGDDNDQPTAPQLPVINIPGITLPSLPSITLDPTININVNDPTNTTPTDYTPWLKAIKDTLTDGFDSLYSELSEHCYHLQEQMQHQAVYIADSITDYMEECITTLVTDMQAIARYIVESLTYYFGNGSYNDNNVIYWLRRIWMRLGGGSPSPVNEPEDAWDWFTKLIVGLLADIIAAGSDLAADVAELISQVMTKFPFSIPWDIAAILGLFAATPVTPHFEVPVNVPNVVNTTLVIDLGFLDGAMATVRAFELIAFAVYLLWMTKDIVKIFDETGFV